jgi:hypothetical protein
MKWLLPLFCFTTISAFSQTKELLLKKLKETQDRLSGKVIIPKQVEKVTPKPKSNLTSNHPYKNLQTSLIINASQQTALIILKQDNMPCLVPNMEFWKTMPNAGGKALLEKPIDPGIYLQKPKS